MKKQNIPLIILFIIFIVLSMFDAKKLTQSAADGITLWATRVVPSLFPFLFCAKSLLALGADGPIQKILGPLLRSMNLPRSGAYPFAVSVLCGYPAGASTLSDMHQNGLITTDQCASLAPLCHTSGPIFVLGYAASISGHNGYMLLLCHMGSVICSGFILGVFSALKKETSNCGKLIKKESQYPVGKILAESCVSAASSMLTVGGFITFFSCVNAMLPLPPLALAPLELTNALALGLNAPACCFMLSFSGICILLQAIALLPQKIKPMKFIGIRLFCGIISAIFCALWQGCSPWVATAVMLFISIMCATVIFILQTGRGFSLPAHRSLQDIPQAPQARRWHKP